MSGQWVRAGNTESAKAFAQEQQRDAERRRAAAERSRQRFAAVLRWVRARLTRRR